MLISRRSRLVLPFGQMPSINYNHPAARGIVRCSVVAKQGNFVDITQAMKPGTMSVAPNSNIDTHIGRTLNLNSSPTVAQCSFGGKPNISDPSLTMAGIIDGRPTSNFQQCIIGNSSNGGGVYLEIDAEPIGMVMVSIWGNSDYLSSVPCTIDGTVDCGVPYFVAASLDPAGIDFISTNLLTGQIFTSHTTTSTAQVTPTGNTFWVANRSSNSNQFGAFTTRGGVAAAMYSAVRLSPAELMMWAADPWSFWYPQFVPSIVGVAALPPVVAGAADGSGGTTIFRLRRAGWPR